jgi:hypothetical protein
MTSTGLQRRRVANNSSSTSTDGSEPSSSNWKSANGSATSSPVAAHAGSAFEGGHKVAFDPRDLERDREESKVGGKMPRLTLMEEVLLLGIKDKQVSGHLHFFNTSGRHTPCRSLPCLLRTHLSQCIRNQSTTNTEIAISSRAICHSGTITYHMHSEDAFSLN